MNIDRTYESDTEMIHEWMHKAEEICSYCAEIFYSDGFSTKLDEDMIFCSEECVEAWEKKGEWLMTEDLKTKHRKF